MTSPRSRNFAEATVPTKPNSEISNAMSKYADEREHAILRGRAEEQAHAREQHGEHEAERCKRHGVAEQLIHSKISISKRS
jgi:hypothetical protein